MRYEATAVGDRVAVLKEAWHLNKCMWKIWAGISCLRLTLRGGHGYILR